MLAAIIASVITGIVERYQSAVDPNRGAGDVVITRCHIIGKVNNISGSSPRRDGTVGVSKV